MIKRLYFFDVKSDVQTLAVFQCTKVLKCVLPTWMFFVFVFLVQKWKLVLALIFPTSFMLHVALASRQLPAARDVPALQANPF